MNAQPVPRPRPAAATLRPLIIGGALGLLFLLSLASFLLDARPASPSLAVPPPGERIVYVSFGSQFDIVFAASATDPARRVNLFEASHADDWGIVASLSRDGRWIAYNALPPNTKAPTADSPAELWVASLRGEPRLLAADVDLLVKPLWSSSGEALVFRRSALRNQADSDFRLVLLNATTGEERELAASPQAALFPVAFAPDGESLLYVRLGAAGSELHAVDLNSGDQKLIALLSPDLTRDWSLSPAGDRLAFLEMAFSTQRMSSRAMVLDLATGSVAPVSGVEADEFSPVWNGSALSLGRLAGAGGVAWASEDGLAALAPPERGFDVPLGWSDSGRSLVVRTFEGRSALAPGRSSLTLVTDGGARLHVASGEVTFLGWIGP
jgi:Tol biopolymer transport system component